MELEGTLGILAGQGAGLEGRALVFSLQAQPSHFLLFQTWGWK